MSQLGWTIVAVAGGIRYLIDGVDAGIATAIITAGVLTLAILLR